LKIGPQVVFEIAGMPITNTLIVAWGITLFLIIVAFVISRNVKVIPGRLQATAELLLVTFEDFIEGMMPGEGRKWLPLIATILLFIGCSNLIGIIPFVDNPTADINTTVAYGLMVFFIAHVTSIRSKGIGGYIKAYFEPLPFLVPLNVIGELAKPVSHSFRLFGNMIGGGIILAILMKFAPWIIPVPLMFWFDLFAGVVQAFIFTMLTIVYIAVLK
jgi:F-type H+-transporting ATPase subunit a